MIHMTDASEKTEMLKFVEALEVRRLSDSSHPTHIFDSTDSSAI